MKVDKLEVTKAKARELFEAYRAHKGQQTPEDAEIESIYRLIGQGKTVIRAVESIKQAGLGEDKRPRLALARADTRACWWHPALDGGGQFTASESFRGPATTRTTLHADTFARPADWNERRRLEGKAMVPIIPVYLRPKAALSNYHILFEAEWSNVPPVDPILLRKIRGDAWLVLAAWDLTPVEVAAMANRISA